MLSPRRSAQFALTVACLTLVASVTILVAGSADAGKAPAANRTANTSTVAASGQVLAGGQLASVQSSMQIADK